MSTNKTKPWKGLKHAIKWIATNDQATCRDISKVSDQMSVRFLAECTGKHPGYIAAKVLETREGAE